MRVNDVLVQGCASAGGGWCSSWFSSWVVKWAPRIAHRRLQSREAKVVSEGADACGVPAWTMVHGACMAHGTWHACVYAWVGVGVFAGLVLACARAWVVDE